MNEKGEGQKISVKNRNVELEATSPNYDKITGLPYEAPGVRPKLVAKIKEWREKDLAVTMGWIDLDNLKGWNDLLGYDGADEAIAAFVKSKEREIDESDWIVEYFFYKPRDGGDEFKVLMATREKGKENQLKETMEEGISFTYEGKSVIVEASTGVAEAKEGEDWDIFRNMEIESESRLDEEKFKRLDMLLKKTVEKGRPMSDEEYIDFASDWWGSRRPTKKAMKLIMLHLKAKVIKRIMGVYQK